MTLTLTVDVANDFGTEQEKASFKPCLVSVIESNTKIQATLSGKYKLKSWFIANLGRVVESWFNESLKSKFSLILFVFNMMTG